MDPNERRHPKGFSSLLIPGSLFDTLTGGMNVAAKLKRVFGDSSLAGFPRIKKLSRLSKSILTSLFRCTTTRPPQRVIQRRTSACAATQVSHHRNCFTASPKGASWKSCSWGKAAVPRPYFSAREC